MLIQEIILGVELESIMYDNFGGSNLLPQQTHTHGQTTNYAR